MAQITVMMAAYNAEKYIARALESLLRQTFMDFDVIVVDDGSTDGTGAIADRYARQDSRIHVLHQKNSGVCVTRNNCLDWAYAHSDSQWLIYVDSDDWTHPEMLERMLGAARENGVKICACGYQETTGEDLVVCQQDLEPVCWPTMDFYQQHYTNAIMTCCKLYHKSCYEGIRNPGYRYYDDEFVTHRVLYPQERIVVIPAALYAYYTNPTSLTKDKWTPNRLVTWDAYEEQIAFFAQHGRQDLVRFRYRGYLDNALVNWECAKKAEDTPENVRARKFIRRRIRKLLRRMWHAGCVEFWFDYDILYACYPLTTKLYRAWLEGKSRFGK